MSEKARSKGLLALEEEANTLEDKFVKSACQMTADAMQAEILEERLFSIIDATTKRHAEAWAIYDKGAAFAPAFGMVGTLVALVNMLTNLDFADAGGVTSLGVNMSMALVTTFYGSLMANVIFIPLGNKLRTSHQNEVFCKELVIAGFLAIQRGENSRNIKEMLVERLDPKTAAKIAST